MIRIHLTGYHQSELDALETALLRGYNALIATCDGECEVCRYRMACNDLHTTIDWLSQQDIDPDRTHQTRKTRP